MGRIAGKTVLVTGGTGSFGETMVERLLREGAKEIRIFSRDEKKQNDQRLRFNDSRLRYVIGDVRDESSLRDCMTGVDSVFHAAALKQVPSCEFFPLEAVKTNVLGSENVLRAAIKEGVERVVVLSTDKAVYPVNAMGLSKGLAEKVAVAKARDSKGTTIAVTRYGNVIGSRGSVIPLFFDQIDSGKSLTITDEKMTRFMMTLDEAAELVMYALSQSNNGSVYVKKSPAATLKTIAKAVMRIKGKEEHPVNYIGHRHGEKLAETLVSSEEYSTAVDHGEYFELPADKRKLCYEEYVSEGKETAKGRQSYCSENAERIGVDRVIELIMSSETKRV